MNQPQILLSLQTFQWLLKTNDTHWLIPIEADAALLAGFIRHEILAEKPEQDIVIEGRAYVHTTEGKSCWVDLIEESNGRFKTSKLEIDFNLDQYIDSGRVVFNAGFFHDGWVSTEATAHLYDTKILGFTLFLQAQEANADIPRDKTITFELNGVEHARHNIIRGEAEIFWLHLPEGDNQPNILKIKSAYGEPKQQDERNLGFHLRELNINFSEWVQYGIIYDKTNDH